MMMIKKILMSKVIKKYKNNIALNKKINLKIIN